MSIITEQDIPGLEEDRTFIKNVVEFHKRGLEIKRLPTGHFEVDPETFIVVIPGEVEKGPEDANGLAWYKKTWDGVTFVCKWFDM